jgi:hypothetical protein
MIPVTGLCETSQMALMQCLEDWPTMWSLLLYSWLSVCGNYIITMWKLAEKVATKTIHHNYWYRNNKMLLFHCKQSNNKGKLRSAAELFKWVWSLHTSEVFIQMEFQFSSDLLILLLSEKYTSLTKFYVDVLVSEPRLVCNVKMFCLNITRRLGTIPMRNLGNRPWVNKTTSLVQDYRGFGLCSSHDIQRNTAFRELYLFLSSGEEWEASTCALLNTR